MDQHVWKVKIVTLWVFQGIDYIAYMLIAFVETGLLGMIKPDNGDGTGIAIIFFTIFILIWLTLVTKPAISRWPNIVFGLLLFILKLLAITGVLVKLSPGIIIVELLGAILAAFVIWYGWKIPKQTQ